MRHGPTRNFAAGVLSLTLAVGIAPAAASASTAHATTATPGARPAFTQPASLAGDQPGQILKSHRVTIEAVGFSVPYQAWQIQYVSESTTGALQADVATVVKPTSPGLPDRKSVV